MIEMLFSNPVIYFMMAASVTLAFVIHEYSHAQMADFLGDPTPREYGRLTLNPLAHFDLIGALMIFTVGFGWGKPVPFNPLNIRNRKWGSLLVGLAGPASNLIMAVLVGLVMRFVPLNSPGLITFFTVFVALNIGLGIFNLLPIPPLDGSHILFTFLPPSLDGVKTFLWQYGFWILIGLIFILPVIPFLLETVRGFIFHLIVGQPFF